MCPARYISFVQLRTQRKLFQLVRSLPDTNGMRNKTSISGVVAVVRLCYVIEFWVLKNKIHLKGVHFK